MSEYQEAGHFSHKDKMKYAIRTTVYWNLGFLAVGLVFIVYLVIRHSI